MAELETGAADIRLKTNGLLHGATMALREQYRDKSLTAALGRYLMDNPLPYRIVSQIRCRGI